MASFFPSKENIRNWLLYELLRRSTVKLAVDNINDINKEAIYIQSQEWFTKFLSGDFDLNYSEKTGRPSVINDILLEKMLTAHPKLTTEEMSNILDCSVTTIKNYLHIIGKSYKVGVWVPHELTEKNKAVKVSVCQSLILKNSTIPFLNVFSLVTKSGFCSTILMENTIALSYIC